MVTTPASRWPSSVVWRLALAVAVIAYALSMRDVVACNGFAAGALVGIPVLAVQALATLVSLVLAVVALVRGRRQAALVELAMALLMLLTVPVAMGANIVKNNACPDEDGE